VLSVDERVSQIPIMFKAIVNMVEEGIKPENIAVILPDEKFKYILKTYDRLNNLNFAMGFDYIQKRVYKQLDLIYKFWKDYEKDLIYNLEIYQIDIKNINSINPNKIVDIKEFFETFSFLDLKLDDENIKNRFDDFQKNLKDIKVSIKSWLFLWLKELSNLKIDDINGGKITVIGALESRGVEFDGVIILDFNDGFVPNIPQKDIFLNSNIRKLAKLPTRADREAHQKQLYKRALERAKRGLILYSNSLNRAPASYIYELGLKREDTQDINLENLL